MLAHRRLLFPPHTCGLRGGAAAVAAMIGEEETERLLPLHQHAPTLDESTPMHLPLGNDPPSAYMRSLVNAVELGILGSVAFPFSYSGTRAILFSLWSGCAYRDMLD